MAESIPSCEIAFEPLKADPSAALKLGHHFATMRKYLEERVIKPRAVSQSILRSVYQTYGGKLTFEEGAGNRVLIRRLLYRGVTVMHCSALFFKMTVAQNVQRVHKMSAFFSDYLCKATSYYNAPYGLVNVTKC